MGLLDWLKQAGKRQAPFPAISCAEASAQSAAGQIILIDVRTDAEWSNSGVPPKAHRKTLQDADFADYLQRVRKQFKGLPIAFFCLSGARSAKAARAAREAGIDDVLIVSGGLEEWRKAALLLDEA